MENENLEGEKQKNKNKGRRIVSKMNENLERGR